MKIIKPSYDIRLTTSPVDMMKHMEAAVWMWYKSEDKIIDN